MRRATCHENASVTGDAAQSNGAAAANALAGGATADPRQGPNARLGGLGPPRRRHAPDDLPPMHAHALPLPPYIYSTGTGAQREFRDPHLGVMYFDGSPGSEKIWRQEWPDGNVWHIAGDLGSEYCHCVETPDSNRHHMSRGECAYQFLSCAPEDAPPDALESLHGELRNERFLPSTLCRGTGLEGLAEKASRRQDEGEKRTKVGEALSPVPEEEEEVQIEQVELVADKAGGASEITPAQVTPASKIRDEGHRLAMPIIPEETNGAEEVEQTGAGTCALAEAAPAADSSGERQAMTSAPRASPSGPRAMSSFPSVPPVGEVTPASHRRTSTGTSAHSPTSQTGGSCAQLPTDSVCASGSGYLGSPVHSFIAQTSEQQPDAFGAAFDDCDADRSSPSPSSHNSSLGLAEEDEEVQVEEEAGDAKEAAAEAFAEEEVLDAEEKDEPPIYSAPGSSDIASATRA